MDFVGGVFLKKLVEIRTDYFTVHSTNTNMYIVKNQQDCGLKKRKERMRDSERGIRNELMNILYRPGNNFLGYQSNTSHELHTCIDSHLTIVDRSVFVANCLDVLLRSNYIQRCPTTSPQKRQPRLIAQQTKSHTFHNVPVFISLR